MKANTIEQFKILEYINSIFYEYSITLKLVNNCTIRVTDKSNKSLDFIYEDNQVKIRK